MDEEKFQSLQEETSLEGRVMNTVLKVAGVTLATGFGLVFAGGIGQDSYNPSEMNALTETGFIGIALGAAEAYLVACYVAAKEIYKGN